MRLLVSDYQNLIRRLKQRLGSEDFASEVLHETYLRLDRMGEVGAPERPLPYLYRTALNVAADLKRIKLRRLTRPEAAAILLVEEHAFDAGRIADGRWEIEALVAALDELPPRCRAIFIEARVHNATHQMLAERYRISSRMVQKELTRAFDHCFLRLERKK
jgi:RNA polymerase sigma factor (sigma-70 family)